MDNVFIMIIVAALITEAVWETSKMFWQDGKVSIDRLGALVIGEIITFGAQLDILSAVGIPLRIPFVGMAFTGLLISRGSNFVHDLLLSLSNVQESTKKVNASTGDTPSKQEDSNKTI